VFFGIGTPGIDAPTLVREWHTLTIAPSLTALVLDQALSVEPVTLGSATDGGCGVDGTSFLHVVRGETSRVWSWTGCVDITGSTSARLRIEGATQEERPNCHGEPGTGLFADDGSLIGIATGARASKDVCIDELEFVPMLGSSERDALDEALERSAI
jgi:hypothetical protein